MGSTDTISLPNFTGSLGYGDHFVQQLVGKCGTLDVDDVMASIKYLLQIGVAVEGPGKQFVQGGSHGGFITGHRAPTFPFILTVQITDKIPLCSLFLHTKPNNLCCSTRTVS